MIKAMAFDLWNTLVEKDITTRKMLQETGSKIPHEKFVKLFEEAIETKERGSEYDAYKSLCSRMDIELNDYNINLLRSIRSEAEDRLRVYDHSIPMIKQLRRAGYKIGVISNSSVFGIRKIREKTKLLNHVDYPVFSYEVGVIKPDLGIFYEFLRRSNLRPEEVVMVGDNPNDDIAPARSMGMSAILFQNYEQLKKDFSSLLIYIK